MLEVFVSYGRVKPLVMVQVEERFSQCGVKVKVVQIELIE